MPAHLDGRRLNGHPPKDPQVNLLVVSLAPVASFTLPILAFQAVFACKGLVTSKLQTTLVLSFRSAVPTILAPSRRPFPPKFSQVRHSPSHVLMPATTICGRDSQHRLNTISTPLDTVLLMLANGAIHPNLSAIMLQLTLALVQRMALPGCLSWPTNQRLPPRTRVPSRSRVTFLALANTRTVNSVLLQDAIQMAAR
jgi:hypothetical protein